MVNVEETDLPPPIMPEGTRIDSGRGFTVTKKKPPQQRSMAVFFAQEATNQPTKKRKSRELVEAEAAMAAPDKLSVDAALSLLRKRKPQPEGALAKRARKDKEKADKQDEQKRAKEAKEAQVAAACAATAAAAAPPPLPPVV